ncbi:PH domain-containing protein [uncultured Jatrophihabitans sp.]|uniref:PH domain-containing protein n=1 Tax=uncultured Jatrophihabitans sp. TaxID=1610747 RepID=UPI0035C9A114
MDNSADVAPRACFAPERRMTALAAAGALLAVVAAGLAGTGPGGLLALIAAVVLAAYAISDVVFSPRLVADADGLRIRTPATRATLAWSDVEHVRADSRLHLGLRSTVLEIDAEAVLVVLSRRAIGTDPEQAADLINAFRPG